MNVCNNNRFKLLQITENKDTDYNRYKGSGEGGSLNSKKSELKVAGMCEDKLYIARTQRYHANRG